MKKINFVSKLDSIIAEAYDEIVKILKETSYDKEKGFIIPDEFTMGRQYLINDIDYYSDYITSIRISPENDNVIEYKVNGIDDEWFSDWYDSFPTDLIYAYDTLVDIINYSNKF